MKFNHILRAVYVERWISLYYEITLNEYVISGTVLQLSIYYLHIKYSLFYIVLLTFWLPKRKSVL